MSPAHQSGAGEGSGARWQDGIADGGDPESRRWVCQNGISDSQKDGRNRGGFFYSDRRSTAGGEH